MKSYSKKLLSFLLAVIMVVTILPAGQIAASAATKAGNATSASPASTITLTNSAVTLITNTSAKITATLSPLSLVSTCGFYIGTAAGALTKQKTETVNGNITSMWYVLSTDWQLLTPGTKYFYKMYATVGGVEYQSDVASFTTTGQAASLTLTNSAVSNLGSTDAKITATLSTMQYVTSCGFYIGATAAALTTKTKTETVNDNIASLWYNLSSDWQPLTPGATYFYKMFVIVNGVEIQSAVASFTTIITVTNNAVVSITNTDARISAAILPLVYVTTAGFYVGTDAAALVKVSENVNANITSISYNVGGTWHTLVPGTTYYYKIFITVNGIEQQSAVSSFKTTGQNPVTTVTNLPVASLTYTDATIAATLSQTVPVTSYGFYIGTSLSTLDKVTKPTGVTISAMSFNLTTEWHLLTPGTKYYYKIFIVVTGEGEKQSDVA
ncbi:MAG: hypothetical protein WCN92_08720, partial [Eubacteriales bacterium]